MTWDDTRRYRHGMRVRMHTPTGPRGVLMQCRTRDGQRLYWKVRLQGSGEWVWPNGMIVDGPGPHVVTCAECGLRCLARTADYGEICSRCEVEMFGPATDDTNETARRRWLRKHQHS